MGLKRRLEKLEQKTGGLYETLYLPDGSQVRFSTEDVLEALSSVVSQEEKKHWLVPILRESEETGGLTGLINALERSYEEANREGR